MKRISFKYDNAKNDSTPEVLVTTQNQHMVRGFNTNYMTKGQATRIQNEWRKITNQRWSMATKERVLMKRVGSPAKGSFRTYRTEHASKMA
tara:strand:- start:22 stop:294 length:273 start_codon:yes stop_codon:yes gene_type:complete